MSPDRRVIALRGATSVAANSAAAIEAATAELLAELLARNGADGADLISIMFTATPDLTAGFPATAARSLGIDAVPLLGASEVAVEGAPERIVRVLIHLYSERDYGSVSHVYLGDARRLREDLAE